MNHLPTDKLIEDIRKDLTPSDIKLKILLNRFSRMLEFIEQMVQTNNLRTVPFALHGDYLEDK